LKAKVQGKLNELNRLNQLNGTGPLNSFN
jgi:hypothetical protein